MVRIRRTIDKSPEALARRARREKVFWYCTYPLVLALYFWAYGFTFSPQGLLVLFLALCSIQTAARTASGDEHTAEQQMQPDKEKSDPSPA